MENKTKLNLTGAIIAKNEEKNIEKCIDNLNFCSHLLVVDDDSNDRTAELAEKKGARVFKRKLIDYSDQRNFALTKSLTDWVVFLDADELFSDKAIKSILNIISSELYDGIKMRRQETFFGKKMNWGEHGRHWIVRVGKKGRGKWKNKVHEVWKINGKIAKAEGKILHTHNDLGKYIRNINRYTDMSAKEKVIKNIKSNILLIIFFPLAKFIQNYFLKLGFLDGVPGFVASMLMSFHSFLSWGKLWIIRKKFHI